MILRKYLVDVFDGNFVNRKLDGDLVVCSGCSEVLDTASNQEGCKKIMYDYIHESLKNFAPFLAQVFDESEGSIFRIFSIVDESKIGQEVMDDEVEDYYDNYDNENFIDIDIKDFFEVKVQDVNLEL